MPKTKKTPVVFNETLYVKAYDLARQGHTDEMLAYDLGIRLFQLERWKRQKPEFLEIIHRARQEYNRARKEDEQSKDLDLSQLTKNQIAFLSAYSRCGNVTRAARASGQNRESHYRWIHEEAYAEAFKQADGIAVDFLEGEAWRRGSHGVERYRFAHNGKPQMIRCEATDPKAVQKVDRETGEVYYEKHYTELEYSDTLLIFLLKARRPELFRDKPVQINQQNNVTLDFNRMLGAIENGSNVIDVDAIDAHAKRIIQKHEDDEDERDLSPY